MSIRWNPLDRVRMLASEAATASFTSKISKCVAGMEGPVSAR
jgi:hypothetical protein